MDECGAAYRSEEITLAWSLGCKNVVINQGCKFKLPITSRCQDNESRELFYVLLVHVAYRHKVGAHVYAKCFNLNL